jgi:hypothetical protein
MKNLSFFLISAIAISTSQASLVSANVKEYSNKSPFVISTKVDSKIALDRGSKSQVISDGNYASGNFGYLTVKDGKYRECGEDNCVEWQPISKLKYIRKGVVLLRNYYYCPYEQSEKGAARIKTLTCTAKGWIKKNR